MVTSRRGGSNEYPQSTFWTANKKIGKPLHIPVLLYKSMVKGGIHYTHVFLMGMVSPGDKFVILYSLTQFQVRILSR